MNLKPLSRRTCLLLILFFGIAAYSNTFNSSFQFDDVTSIVQNQSFRPPLNLVKIWQDYPPRFIANISFAFQYAFTGEAPWGFHGMNLLIHLLAAMVVFAIARMLLRTPALQETVPPSQHNVFALAPALLFLTHPVQTQAVTYIVQRMTSLAALFYLATLWMYLKARLENTRYYRLVFLFMLAAMLTKEISFTLPFAILLIDVFFFPVSANETVRGKIRRWIPFAAFLLIAPLIYMTSSVHFAHSGSGMDILPADDINTSRWDYILTQFRVLRTYLRLLIFPVNQCIDYDYRLSSGWGDFDTWSAFSLLLGIFILAIGLFKKNRLLSFGILWFFLTLSVESSFIPISDVIFEHRLYLPMFGFSFFLTFLLWRCIRSASRFLALTLLIAVVLSTMTYARNEVWKNPFTLWQDAIKKSPHKGRPYCCLGYVYANDEKNRNDQLAIKCFQKASELGYRNIHAFRYMANSYARLGKHEESLFYNKLVSSLADSAKASDRALVLYNFSGDLREKNKKTEAIETLLKAISLSPSNPLFYLRLGETYRETNQEEKAIAAFRKAIELTPLSEDGYHALALFYKEKGNKQKALAVLVEYLTYKKKHKPLFGN